MKKEKNNRDIAPQAKRKAGWQRPMLIVVCVVLALLLILLLITAGFMHYMLGSINRTNVADNYTLSAEDALKLDEQQRSEEEVDPTVPVMDENDVIWEEDPSEIVGNDNNIVNILLIGQDRRSGEGRARSDAMILCTINKTKKTLIMTSFLRDLYVQIPGYQDNRLNTAYALGGMELLDETLMVNFGVHVDANVEVDFTAFQSVIDALGGVDISLTESEANHLNSNNGWSLSSGVSHLDGEQALAYSRIRYLDSDFYRTNRQRNVLTSLINSVRDSSLENMLGLINTVLPLITTDMTDGQIIRYAMDLFPLLSDCTIETQHIPADDAYQSASIRGMSVLVPDLEANRQLLIDTLS